MSARYPDTRTKLTMLFGYLPQRRRDDVLIIGHPRSGNTWLRTMLTNVLDPEANSNPDVFNKIIPGVSFRDLGRIRRLPSPRFLSSHTSFVPGLPKVVYIIRDGRDALVSFYRYMTTRKRRMKTGLSGSDICFPEFFRRYYKGEYCTIWHQHVESWLEIGLNTMGRRMMVLKYEDMKENPERTLEEVLNFSNTSHERHAIAEAVEKTNINKVRKIEKERWKEKGLGEVDKEASFYGRARSGNWQGYFTTELMDEFLRYSEKAFALAGYQTT